jgi:hypothetical protein
MQLAIITPAFSKHLPLLEISAESVDRYCPEDIKQYVIVSGREYHLFRHLEGVRRKIIIAEDVLPFSAFCLPVFVKGREVWLVDWHRLVGGWIVQQIIKLCAPEISRADVFVYLDTDVFFIRPFARAGVLHEGRVRLWKQPGNGAIETHMRWHRAASKLLGLPSCDYYGWDFIGNVITWRRDILLAMRARIAAVSGIHWSQAIVREKYLSEYILYGVFVQELLGIQDNHHLQSSDEVCLDSWNFLNKPGTPLQQLRERLRPSHIAVNIQSTLRLPASDVRELVDAAVLLSKALNR